jgi:hypothetical protein
MDRLLTDNYPNPDNDYAQYSSSSHVLMIVIDGASGIAVNEAYNTKKAPVIRSMTDNALFTFYGLADKEEGVNKGRGQANLLTGTTSNGLDNTQEVDELETPSFLQRLKETDENMKVSLYSSDEAFFNAFGSAADTKSRTSIDSETTDALIAEIGGETTSNMIVAQFSGVQQAGEQAGFWVDENTPTSEVIDAIYDVDVCIGKIKKALEARPLYAQENWLIVVTSTYGGDYTGSLSIKTRYDDPRLNIFSMVYNQRMARKLLLKPADNEGLTYSYVTPVYTPSTTGAYVAAVVNDPTLFNLPEGKSFTLQLMLIDRNKTINGANGSGIQSIVSKATNYNNTRQNGEWLLKYDGSNTRYWHTSNNDTQVTSNTSENGPAKNSPYTFNRQATNFTVLTFVHDFDCGGKTMPNSDLSGGTYTARSGGEIRTYRNGMLARYNLALRTSNLTMENNTKPLTIGQIYTSASISTATAFSVVNLQIYDTVLPPDYLEKNFNKAQIDLDSISCPYWDHLIGYWPCDREEDRELGVLRDYSRYGSVYGGINAGKSDMTLTGNIQWYEDATIEPNVRPLPSESFYKTVINTVDLPYQIFQWFGRSIDSSWNFDGVGWTLSYTSLNN